MKTTNLITAFLLILFLGAIGITKASASGPEMKDICTVLKETVCYPPFAIREGIEGSVKVDFSKSDDGKIILKKVESTNPELKNSVTNQITGLDLKATNTEQFKTYQITFTFALQ
jgi:outer membrane biosynthesis protein TonB